jgi:hypothetical protein
MLFVVKCHEPNRSRMPVCQLSLAAADIPSDEAMDEKCHKPTKCIAAKGGLFDKLVGSGEQLIRHSEAERLCRLEVDDQLELGWLLHR